MARAPDGDSALKSQLAEAVGAACQPTPDRPTGLLPTGTVVDRAEWVGDRIHVDLTLPGDQAQWRLTDTEVEGLSELLVGSFLADSSFGGTIVRVRFGPEDQYGSLARLLPPPAPARAETAGEPFDVAVPAEGVEEGTEHQETSLGGPTAQAGRQPTGALSGVTIYTTAGHGWTAGSSSWALQRPVLLSMAEDYGNIDQLNYFVHYAFNAGATVMPFRPVGWQKLEVVLDNDDPGVTYTGTWNNSAGTKYYENHVTSSGISYRYATASTSESATARFTPTITVTDFYPVYCFAIAGTNRVIQTYRIAHSGGLTEVRIDHRETGNGWIWLGNYHLEAGGTNYVEITNQSTVSGVVVADGIRWGNGMGDIVRPGPGTVSGYPQDEECMRYWAHSELGNNGVGFDSDIWDGGGSADGDDNVRCGAKWAREMNQVPGGGILVDRWKRVYLEFHSNASGGARGQICLITDLGATTYQTQLATMLSNEFDADLLIADSDFEYTWYDRSSPTYTASYGAICTPANSDEFDATIIEVAFHDEATDAQLLRDDRVRAAMARACVHGLTRFLNTLAGSPVPLAFAPDTPRNFRAQAMANGDIVLSWSAPLSDGARGDPATGYVVYPSTNGYGFGNPIVLGSVLTTTISGIPAGETRYFRVAATNAGGESMPSETLAVRGAGDETSTFLIVSGFDRLRRQQNPIQNFTQPPAYAGKWIERQIWSRTNSYDYAVQHALALAAGGATFDSCVNEAVVGSAVALGGYAAVDWISGEESNLDLTFDATEQSKLTTYLGAGGNLFASGAEIGYDLDAMGHGASFYNNYLKADYVSDDAGTYNVNPVGGSIFNGVPAFSFDNGTLFYDVDTPDRITTFGGSTASLSYSGGSGGTAGVVYDGAFRVVTFGFPFETITSSSVRAQIMDRIIGFFFPGPFDVDRDGDVDLKDYASFVSCLQGPLLQYLPGDPCRIHDADDDLDVDLADFAEFAVAFTGS